MGPNKKLNKHKYNTKIVDNIKKKLFSFKISEENDYCVKRLKKFYPKNIPS